MRILVRVELHKPMHNSYDVLHAQMTARSFTNDIVADKGGRYQLPPAEYRSEAYRTAQEAGAAAEAAAVRTGCKASVVAIEAENTIWWTGLEQLPPRRLASSLI